MRVFGALLRGSRNACTGLVQRSHRAPGVGYAGISQSARLAMLNRAYSTDPQSPKDQPPKSDSAKDGKPNDGPEASERFPDRTFGGPSARKERLFPETGPLSLPGIVLFVVTAGGIVYYFTSEKNRVKKERAEKLNQVETVGTAEIGGAYELIDQDGKVVTNKDFHGKFHLVYFG
ncbi:Cu-binding protein, partial [Coemansia sp. RSA 2618]